jgi:hypothetical protein
MRSAPMFQLVTMPDGEKHVDCVIGDALNENPELLFCLPHTILRRFNLFHLGISDPGLCPAIEPCRPGATVRAQAAGYVRAPFDSQE